MSTISSALSTRWRPPRSAPSGSRKVPFDRTDSTGNARRLGQVPSTLRVESSVKPSWLRLASLLSSTARIEPPLRVNASAGTLMSACSCSAGRWKPFPCGSNWAARSGGRRRSRRRRLRHQRLVPKQVLVQVSEAAATHAPASHCPTPDERRCRGIVTVDEPVISRCVQFRRPWRRAPQACPASSAVRSGSDT